ncbi:MAG: hypothetical protein E7595_03740 [Ruminococcaceae bacterium]|nr:hypothetical protein [Oscillospiraceae bacterium]
MKKLIYILFAAVMLFTAACSDNSSENGSEADSSSVADNSSVTAESSNDSTGSETESSNDESSSPETQPTRVYFDGEYCFDNAIVKKSGNLAEWYSYNGENDDASVIGALENCNDDVEFYLGVFVTSASGWNDTASGITQDFLEQADILKESPYYEVDFAPNDPMPVIPPESYWSDRATDITNGADLTGYCTKQLALIPEFMYVGYVSAKTLKEFSENGTVDFYITLLPEDENGKIWLDSIKECPDEYCDSHVIVQ